MLDEIVKELEMPSGERNSIPASQVRRWMKTEDAVSREPRTPFLSKSEFVQKVTPPLSFDEVFDFILRYYGFCLKTDPKSRWADGRYSPGWDLVGWFNRCGTRLERLGEKDSQRRLLGRDGPR